MEKLLDFNFKDLTSRRKIVVVLGLLIGTLHLLRGVLGFFPIITTYDIIFILNFGGNVFLIVILYFVPSLEKHREYIRWIYVAFTLSSIVIYIITYIPAGIRALLTLSGVFDKLMEVALIVLLIMDRPLEENIAEHGAHQVSGSPQKNKTQSLNE